MNKIILIANVFWNIFQSKIKKEQNKNKIAMEWNTVKIISSVLVFNLLKQQKQQK